MEKPLISDLNADEDPEILEIESLCLHCFKKGTTRLLLVRIAFFREVVVSSFTCSHCGFENRKVDPVTEIQEKGQRFALTVQSSKDLNRRVVRPSGSTIIIPKFDASFPTSEGDLSTVEGIILKVIENIDNLQPERRVKSPELAAKLQSFVDELKKLLELQESFQIILDDPTGNGYVENLVAPDADPLLQVVTYKRTTDQEIALGYRSEDQCDQRNPPQNEQLTDSTEPVSRMSLPVIDKDEVLTFKANCPVCNAPSDTNMKLVDIPHFKQVVIMATVCPKCGHRDCEVKSGSGMSEKGRSYRLRITTPSDLSRDVLVSETAAVILPDLDLQSMGGTLGGRFTTLEGMLLAVRDQLIGANPFILGDSTDAEEKGSKLATVIERLKKIAAGEESGVIFELRDPAGNSYVQNIYAPDPDPEMETTDYDRTAEENDELGITDMHTNNYSP